MCRCVTYAFWYVAASAVPYRETFHQVLTNASWPNKCECFVSRDYVCVEYGNECLPAVYD